MQMNNGTREYKRRTCESEASGLVRRLTGHDTNITVAIGQDIVERGLLRQTPDDWRLGEGAHFLLLLHVEALHLVGQTHHLS